MKNKQILENIKKSVLKRLNEGMMDEDALTSISSTNPTSSTTSGSSTTNPTNQSVDSSASPDSTSNKGTNFANSIPTSPSNSTAPSSPWGPGAPAQNSYGINPSTNSVTSTDSTKVDTTLNGQPVTADKDAAYGNRMGGIGGGPSVIQPTVSDDPNFGTPAAIGHMSDHINTESFTPGTPVKWRDRVGKVIGEQNRFATIVKFTDGYSDVVPTMELVKEEKEETTHMGAKCPKSECKSCGSSLNKKGFCRKEECVYHVKKQGK